MGIWLIGYFSNFAWIWLRKKLGIFKLYGKGTNGVHWGAARLTATHDFCTIERAKFRSSYRWPAILRVEQYEDVLLLMLSPSSGVVVPRSVFDQECSEDSFRQFVEQRIGA